MTKYYKRACLLQDFSMHIEGSCPFTLIIYCFYLTYQLIFVTPIYKLGILIIVNHHSKYYSIHFIPFIFLCSTCYHSSKCPQILHFLQPSLQYKHAGPISLQESPIPFIPVNPPPLHSYFLPLPTQSSTQSVTHPLPSDLTTSLHIGALQS